MRRRKTWRLMLPQLKRRKRREEKRSVLGEITPVLFICMID